MAMRSASVKSWRNWSELTTVIGGGGGISNGLNRDAGRSDIRSWSCEQPAGRILLIADLELIFRRHGGAVW